MTAADDGYPWRGQAKYVVYEGRLGPESPGFFCDECWRRAHTDSDGRLVDPAVRSFLYLHD